MTQLDSRVGTIDFMGEKTARVGSKAAKGEDRVEIVAGLAGYLAKLGLADGELDQMITMLQSGQREDPPGEVSKQRPAEPRHRCVLGGRAADPQRSLPFCIQRPAQYGDVGVHR